MLLIIFNAESSVHTDDLWMPLKRFRIDFEQLIYRERAGPFCVSAFRKRSSLIDQKL